MTTVERQVTHVRALERLNEKQAAEIQRLRAAMVHAMDESEHEAACAGSMLARTNLKRIADGLRSVLETP